MQERNVPDTGVPVLDRSSRIDPPPEAKPVPARAKSRTLGGLVEDYRILRFPAGLPDRATSDHLKRWQIRWGHRPIEAITSREIDLYLRELALQGFTPRELGRERSNLSSFFWWLQHNGFTASNPIESVAPPPQRPQRTVALNPTESVAPRLERPQRAVIWSRLSQRKLLLACRNPNSRGTHRRPHRGGPHRAGGRRRDKPSPYLCPLVLVALETGLRLENLLYLAWGHVDLITDTLRLPASEVRGKRPLEFKIPPGSARFLRRLWGLISHRRKKPALVFEPLGLPRKGGAPDEEAIHEELLRACHRADIPPGDFDSIRKTFAWNSARSGMPFLKTATIVDWGDLADLVDAYHQDAPLRSSFSTFQQTSAARPSS